MSIRINKWPFREGESAVLHWLRSPYQEGEDKQWRMSAVFRGKDDALKDVNVPWGMLPILRLGRAYRDGIAVDDVVREGVKQIRFSSAAKVTVSDAAAVPRDLYRLLTKWNLQEKCCIIWNGGERIIVPCLEVIRAYFALSRLVAGELLKPDSFNGLCTSTVENGKAYLSFSEKVPASTLTFELVRRVALILEESSFSTSWRRVWTSASSGGGTDMRRCEPAHPLICEPPAIQGSSWDVVGVGSDKIFVVLEIRQFSFPLTLPFSSVSCEHPSFREYEGGGRLSGVFLTREDPDEIVIGPTPSAPKNLSSPHTVETNPCTASFTKNIWVEKVKKKAPSIVGVGESSKVGGVQYEPVTRVEGSLDDEAGVGEQPAVEFLPVESLEETHPAFRRLSKALKQIQKIDIRYQHAVVPEECKLPLLNGNRRAYVLVCFTFSRRLVYLLEVDNSDGHMLSTIIFVLGGVSPSAASVAEIMLQDCVALGGHWNRERLRSLLGEGKHNLAKHTRSKVNNWGARLHNAACILISK